MLHKQEEALVQEQCGYALMVLARDKRNHKKLNELGYVLVVCRPAVMCPIGMKTPNSATRWILWLK